MRSIDGEVYCIYAFISPIGLHKCSQKGFIFIEFLHNT